MIEEMEGTAFFAIKERLYLFIKRTFDIFFGLIGCILLIPITIIIKIISILSGDFTSIFFVQDRIGKDGKIFKLYKFRSMVPDADKVLEEILKRDKKAKKEYEENKKFKDDPRVTKIGKILRRTSIDELPQFINVFLGNMSVIGNRPYLPREKDDMKNYYEDIVKTKPGITGYWQVSGRKDVTFKQRLKLESYYSNHRGLKLDIKIFFQTFKAIIGGHGAGD